MKSLTMTQSTTNWQGKVDAAPDSIMKPLANIAPLALRLAATEQAPPSSKSGVSASLPSSPGSSSPLASLLGMPKVTAQILSTAPHVDLLACGMTSEELEELNEVAQKVGTGKKPVKVTAAFQAKTTLW